MPVLNKPLEHLTSTADLRDLKTRLRAAQAMKSMVEHETPKDRPSVAKLMYAAELELFDENNRPIRFGQLVESPSHSRTVVVFVRHWLSPSCASYLRALISELTPTVLAKARARVVLIGHGAVSMIKGFRQHLQCPFPVYTDPSRRLHDVLELSPRALGNFKSEFSTSSLRSAKEMLMGAARMHGLRAGNRSQLGGEFVFEGSLRVLFTHRMLGDGDHAPVRLVVSAVSAPIQRPPRAVNIPRRSSMYVSQALSEAEPRPTYSCTSLVDGPSRTRPLAFPLPPLGSYPSPDDFGSWDEERSVERHASKSGKSPVRDAPLSSGVAIVHPEDIDRVTGELQQLCSPASTVCVR